MGEGQISIFDVDTSYMDKHYDRQGKEISEDAWKWWLKYERCENCTRWVRYPVDEQPPAGWGVYGFCQEHKGRCCGTSRCQDWEDKRRI